jgi:hypothetical protein
LLERARTGDVQIITYNLSDAFGPLATERMRAEFPSLLTTTNVFFDGLHPDITHIGGFQERVLSPLGNYHSRIVLFGFMTGRSAQECFRLFQSKIYEQAGYFSAYERSAAELVRRDEQGDIRFAEAFLDMVREVPVMLTINHPTISVFCRFSEIICRQLNIPYDAFPPEYFSNPLLQLAQWPIYAEIAEAAKLSYRTPMLFKPNEAAGSNYMGLREFVSASYKLYEALGRDALRESSSGRKVLEQFSFLG